MRGAHGEPDLARRIHTRIRTEQWTLASWLIATATVVLAVHLMGSFAFPVAWVGVAVTGWVARRLWAVWLAKRALLSAQAPPRKAYAVYIMDPAPGVLRPLLAIWQSPPEVLTGSFAMPHRVYRCDEEVDDLLSMRGDIVVHEVWVSTGPRESSMPRWVLGNDGVAVPHRRALNFGRGYFHRLTWAERPKNAVPLTVAVPCPNSAAFTEPSPSSTPGLLRLLPWRFALLAGFGAFIVLLFPQF